MTARAGGADSMDRGMRRAAEREALASSLWSDLVIYGLVAAVIGAGAMLARGFDVYAAALAAAGAGGSLASFAFTYARERRRLIGLHLREWQARLALVRDEELVRLATRLEELGNHEGPAQIRRLEAEFGEFRRVLGRKFDAAELTYRRYELILENLFLAAVDNLERAAEHLESAVAAGGRHFDPRDAGPSPDALRRSCDELLGRNDAMLAALERAGLEMSNVRTRRGRARIELEGALAELSRMIDNVHRYALDDA